jgi:hypothetical protein
LGEDKGLKLFRDIVAANGISVRKGHTLLANLVVTGEVPLALTAYAYKAEQLRKSGAPIGWFVIPPGVARGRRRRPPRLASECCNPVLRVHAHRWAGYLACSRFLSGSGERKAAAGGCFAPLSRSRQRAG